MTTPLENTLAEREAKYGSFKDNAEISQRLEVVIRSKLNYSDCNNVHREALHMILHKVARIINGDADYIDNWHDIAGYAQLVEEDIKERNLISDAKSKY